MLPPSATSRPASLSTWAISAVVVDLPLVPVTATNGASGARAARSRAKSSMSPTIGDARFLGELHRPVRFRMGQRHAGREHEQPEAPPVGRGEIGEPKPGRGCALARLGAVVPGRDLGAAFDERAQRRQARAAEAEDRDALAAKGFDRRHRHLSFSEARPTIASTKAMIQKRMTICGSDQPSCSK